MGITFFTFSPPYCNVHPGLGIIRANDILGSRPPAELILSCVACTVWASGDPEEREARLGSTFIS